MRGTINLIILVAFTILAYVYKDWHPGFASVFIFYLLFTISLYEAVQCFTMFRRLQVERIIEKKRLFVGDSQEIVIRIKRRHRFPFAWYAAYENLPRKLSYSKTPIVFPWFRKEWEIRYRLHDLPRGQHELTEIVVQSGDIFGFIKGERLFFIPETMLVYPHYRNLNSWTVRDSEKSGRKSVFSRTTTERTSLAGIREYQYGDRQSQINWKATARSATLKSKEFEAQVTRSFFICLDIEQRAYGPGEQFEKAVSLVASLIHLGYKRQLKWSLLSAGVNDNVEYMEGTTEFDFYRFLDYLALVQRIEGQSLHGAAVSKVMNLSRGTHLVFVTGTVDRELALFLSELAHKKRTVELFLIARSGLDTGQGWLKTLSRNGVICHCESA